MSQVSLSEFLLLSGLSSDEVLSLLEHGDLMSTVDERGRLRITIRPEDRGRFPGLASDPLPNVPPTVRPLVEEVIATELLSFLDAILPEAVALAESWASATPESPVAIPSQKDR